MPSINRIRVNNVKYNFGTQFYDDFTMRMHGKNTLYDLANGGGKSVLMLLLLQNMIPNCTLDEKQPIEKLFRTGNGNTTIHSLVEWKLDDGDDKEGYRYMTTGFCARKAKDSEDSSDSSKDVASIEYFNYCIFYRDFNANDIVNLPLVKDGVRMNFTSLRNYLKELEHNDMRLRVRIFDRKGEYQRYISDFGLHESQWEIIRGINKTEGHVRTYFENNYKTTRKVVEDLLIEEIIEKAFLVKTSREENGADNMAKMLMDIKEQLTVLAKKKKDIANYDHQIELIKLLADKVGSFTDIYREKSDLTKVIANICVTGAEFAKNDEAKMSALAAKKEENQKKKDEQKKHIECLKIARDNMKLKELKDESKEIEKKISDSTVRLQNLEEDYNLKESVNEYIDYMSDREKYYQYDAIIKNMMSESSFDEELLYQYAYNIKMRMDIKLKKLEEEISKITAVLLEKKLAREHNEKLLKEASTEYAVAQNKKEAANAEIVSLSEKLAKIRMSMNDIRFTGYEEQMEENKAELDNLLEKRKSLSDELEEQRLSLNEQLFSLSMSKEQQKETESELLALNGRLSEYEEASGKLLNIREIYGASDEEQLLSVISKRITAAILELDSIDASLAESDKRIRHLEEGRIIEHSEAVNKMLTYIESRHGVNALSGMDYVSALPMEKRRQILDKNPEIIYGVVARNFDDIKDDPNIREVDTGSTMVLVYDIDELEQGAVLYGENAFAVGASCEYLTADDTIDILKKKEQENVKELHMKQEVKEEMLAAYREDEAFVIRLKDSELLATKDKLRMANAKKKRLDEDVAELEDTIASTRKRIDLLKDDLQSSQTEYENCLEDNNKLATVASLSELITKHESTASKADADIKRLSDIVNELTNSSDDDELEIAEMTAKLADLEKKVSEINNEWDEDYKAYYNIDKEYGVLSNSDDELKARFKAYVSAGSEDAKAIEDKRVLMDTIKISMERTLKNIDKKKVDINTLKALEKENQLYASDLDVLAACVRSIDSTKGQLKNYEAMLKDKNNMISKLEGSIEYAIENLKNAYGSYEEIDANLSDIVTYITDSEKLLKRLDDELKASEQEYKDYFRQQGYMVDLYKDVKRIVTMNDIDLSDAEILLESKEKLREMFESALMSYDKCSKRLEKAINELIKFKGNTASTLDEMEVYELANTIRDDVVIPEDIESAEELLKNLNQTTEYISLERDRIEKSLVDMETIKKNFEEQCLQRCLDVKTELDKLPKLSRIIVDGEAISMVGLTIPYIKDEFLKQRMSDYIDKIVANADDYDKDADRIKFIRNSLALKKLFGVIVTDMNAIKLMLYKRERIKEQSRYLKYEEAVGSTGQSQGIYIQFLVSIINYISGMYQLGNEDTRTKTIFIDNPFGAAKDVYIWEPIFAMLKANKVQLIVPARGATPAITGRFDVNYILGQQMSSGKQLTVVTDYTSQVDQEELEYRELVYEQASFDFI